MSTAFTVNGEITGLGQSRPRLPTTVGNCKISHIAFHNNSTAIPTSPVARLTIRDVAIYRCHHWACYSYGVVFDNINLTEVRGGGVGAKAPSFLWGCVLSHVRIRGAFTGIWWRWRVDPNDDGLSRRFLSANLAFYESVDWALDITEARFSIYESLLGIPSRLVKRDRAKHFVMTRDGALRLLNQKGDPTVWRITAQELVDTGLPDTVIVVGGSGKRQRAYLDEAKSLCDGGLLA